MMRAPLAALFLVSSAALGFEIALTRLFAITKWSEYGYWVISIVLAGFAVSGVLVALLRAWCLRHVARLWAILPPLLVASAAAGAWLAAANPFNPLQLQNPATLWSQLANIAGYYAVLLPFFTLAGLFISLCFMADSTRIGVIYATDLIGAGVGAAACLALMAVVHPFYLVACLLPALAFAALFVPRGRVWSLLASVLALAAGEAALIGANPARINDFKAIYAPLHVPDSRRVAELRAPRGLYDLLDDFTERVDTDVSNNAGMLGLPPPPTALGLYRDGNRIAALSRSVPIDARYAPATLAALPYALRPHARVLLGGASGGFRVAEARALGAASIDAAEPEPTLRGAIRHGLGPAPPLPLAAGERLLADPPLALARPGRYDIVDISGDFLDSAESAAANVSVEAIMADLSAVAPDGIVSIPVSIREFPAYATRMIATVGEALRRAGVADPALHVLVYRSAWNVRILVSPAPLATSVIAAARAWCDERSFDVSYYPGIDVAAARANIYNDLPAVSFAEGAVMSGDGPHDAVADEALAALNGSDTPSARSFDLSPITLDRPTLNAVLRLTQLDTILARLEVLPQGEVAPLVNVAVLAQAAVIALAVLALPLVARRRIGGGDLGRAALYFPALGLAFLMIEIAAIEAATVLLSDRTWAFALVLTAMLVFSGVGSLLGERARQPRRALAFAIGTVLAWCAAMLVLLPAGLIPLLSWPLPVRAVLLAAVLALVSVPLGMPFPLGLARLERRGGALPWAWALNGAFSVVATPLANLIAIELGHGRLLIGGMVLYAVAFAAFPRAGRMSWTHAIATSPAAL